MTTLDGGQVQLRRRFGWTATLSATDRVFLVVGDVQSAGAVSVNTVPLGPLDPKALPARFEISALLRPRNEAVIQVAGGRVGNVRLEIYSNSSSGRTGRGDGSNGDI
jgi:hypothetical protein